MTLSSERILKLMAYADGELEGAERDEVETLLASEPDAARFVESLVGLGDFVKSGHQERDARAIASFDVADAVMARVRPEAKVVSLEAARQKRAAQTRIALGLLAAAAVAASVFFLARPGETPMGHAPASPVAQAPQPAAPSEVAGAEVQVTAVESAGGSVSVFYLPSANDVSTSVVIWVDETGEK